MNNVLTASRMNCMMQCPRKHFYTYEVGLRKVDDSTPALRIGSAWARAMELRWLGASYEDALNACVKEGMSMDDFTMATISGLLAAYYEVYGSKEMCGRINPELQFQSELGDGVFTCEGKIDGLGTLADGRSVIIEGKTTSDSIAPDSDYWMRLTFNMQVLNYIVEARKLGWDIATCYYDVTRKPTIHPLSSVNDLDEQGRKIVVDSTGERVFAKDGITPRLTADTAKGYVVKSHPETPAEFCDRLYKDCLERPDYYFTRREVPVMEDSISAFIRQRDAIAGMIIDRRAAEPWTERDSEVWPRNVSENTCDFCQCKSFCLQNISVDLSNPPMGFQVKGFNPELNAQSV